MTVRPSTVPAAPTADLLVTVVLGVAFCLVWSSAFSVGKILLLHAPPFTVLAMRFFAATLIAGGIALALGQPLPRTREAWRQIVVLGLYQNALYLGLFFAAMSRIPAGLASIVASALPLIVAVLAAAILRERVGGLKAAGLLVGFAGVVFVMVDRVTGGVDPLGVALVVGGVLALAFATITVRRGDFGTGLLMVVACQMAVGGIACLLVALLFEDPTAIEVTATSATAFFYMVLFPGIVATLLW